MVLLIPAPFAPEEVMACASTEQVVPPAAAAVVAPAVDVPAAAPDAASAAGNVVLLETFGSDLTVVNAARVSFDKEVAAVGPADARLIHYLARHEHVSPFFHPQVRFRLRMPIFLAREWFRHTVGFARNEVSRRYVDTPPQCWLPRVADGLRMRDPRLKQGSKQDEVHPRSAELVGRMAAAAGAAVALYEELLDQGVAPELARTVLPQSMYTEFIETGSLAAYARLCGLRLDPDARREVREYAAAVSEALAAAFPVSWAALTAASHQAAQ
jgi:thymidylate synthase (FAD)